MVCTVGSNPVLVVLVVVQVLGTMGMGNTRDSPPYHHLGYGIGG